MSKLKWIVSIGNGKYIRDFMNDQQVILRTTEDVTLAATWDTLEKVPKWLQDQYHPFEMAFTDQYEKEHPEKKPMVRISLKSHIHVHHAMAVITMELPRPTDAHKLSLELQKAVHKVRRKHFKLKKEKLTHEQDQ
jgi:hypothetical protein